MSLDILETLNRYVHSSWFTLNALWNEAGNSWSGKEGGRGKKEMKEEGKPIAKQLIGPYQKSLI